MSLLRKRDFKRQIEGKRPERKAKENMKISRENPEVNVNMDTARLRIEAQMNQNQRIPH